MKMDYFFGLSEEGFHHVAYTEWGKPNDSLLPIICVHGLTRQGRDFDSLAEYFSYLGCHLFCPDIVGRGDSDWLKNPLHYTYEQYIADMNAMIARTGVKQVDWIGTSMGGLIGMIMASLPNSPIRRLVLNDIGPQIPIKALNRLSKYAGKDPDFTSMNDAKRYFKLTYADFGNLSEEQWDHLTIHNIREISPGKFISKTDHGVKMSPAKSKLAWNVLMNPHKALEGTLFDIDLWHIWRNVTCPVFVIHGEKSDILLPDIIRKMQQIHPDTTVLQIPDAGHAPVLMNQEEQKKIYQWLHN